MPVFLLVNLNVEAIKNILSYMKIKIIILLLLIGLINLIILKADVGSFDIIEISNQNKSYYLVYDPEGLRLKDDLCYYDSNGVYQGEVQDYIGGRIEGAYEIEVYEELHVIELEKFAFYSEFEPQLFILKNKKTISNQESNYEIVAARNGNTYGFVYTEELSESDNDWIKDYPIQHLLNVPDEGFCEMALYGIQGNTTKEEIVTMKATFEKSFKKDRGSDFYKIFLKLYKINIIMIGFCSC